MFDLAIVHRPGLAQGKQDLGRILEAMLYYDRVHIVLSGQLFAGLWDQLGGDDLAALLAHPGVTSTLTPEMTSMYNETRGGMMLHFPVAIRLSGRAGKIIADHDDVGSLLKLIEGNPNRSDATRSQINKIASEGKITKYSKLLGGDSAARERVYALARDPVTIKMFVRSACAAQGLHANEDVISNLVIDTYRIEEKLMIAASHNLSDIASGWKGEQDWGSILNSIQDYAIDLYLSSSFSADILTTPSVEQVAAARLDLSLQRAIRSAEQISAFEEMVFEAAHGFSSAFNKGLIDLREALKIIDEARRFRTWTRGLAPDANLLAEYHKAIMLDTPLKRFPMNILRFALFNFGGMASDAVVMPGSGTALSAIDTFVVERLMGGWRPNVFVRNLKRRLDAANNVN